MIVAAFAVAVVEAVTVVASEAAEVVAEVSHPNPAAGPILTIFRRRIR